MPLDKTAACAAIERNAESEHCSLHCNNNEFDNHGYVWHTTNPNLSHVFIEERGDFEEGYLVLLP